MQAVWCRAVMLLLRLSQWWWCCSIFAVSLGVCCLLVMQTVTVAMQVTVIKMLGGCCCLFSGGNVAAQLQFLRVFHKTALRRSRYLAFPCWESLLQAQLLLLLFQRKASAGSGSLHFGAVVCCNNALAADGCYLAAP
jgi:hypothetical protein